MEPIQDIIGLQLKNKQLIVFCFLNIFYSFLLTVNGIFLGKAIDWIEGFPLYSLVLFVMFLFAKLVLYLFKYLIDKKKIVITTQMETSLRTRLYSAILFSDRKWWDKQDSGETKEILTDQLNEAVGDAVTLIIKFMEVVIGLSTAVISAFWVDYFTAWIVCLYFPVAAWISIAVGRKCQDTHKTRQRTAREEIGVLDEILHAARDIIIYQKENYFTARGNDAVHKATEGMSKHLNRVAMYRGTEEISKTVGFIAIILIGLARSNTGAATLGSIIIMLGLADSIFLELSQINYVNDLFSSTQSYAKAFESLLKSPQHLFGSTSANEESSPSVEFRNVFFAYEPAHFILRNFSLSVEQGEHVAVIGPSGHGKTTVFNLALQLYAPDTGEVRLFGEPSGQLSYQYITSHIAAAIQKPYIFHDTCFNNIAWGNARCSEEQVRMAAVLAGFPQEGLDSFLQRDAGENGNLLSGGERQRIALAWCFLRNADIIFLDEPTSMLDAGTEHIIMENIKNKWKGKTVLIISHYTNSEEYVDRILKVEIE